MAWESLYPEIEVADLKGDKKAAEKVEQYKISENAVYMPGNRFIPLGAVTKLQVRNATMNSKGCCGLSIPIFNVVLFNKGDNPIKIMCEKERNADRIIEIITSSHPEIVVEEYIPPHKNMEIGS